MLIIYVSVVQGRTWGACPTVCLHPLEDGEIGDVLPSVTVG